MRRSRRRSGLTIALLFGLASAVVAWIWLRPSAEDYLQKARRELALGHYRGAKRAARRALTLDAQSGPARLLVAEAATKLGNHQEALHYYQQIPQQGTPESVAALFGTAEIWIHLGRLSDGEQMLRRVLGLDSDHVLAHYRLAFVLGITGRSWEALPHGVKLIQHGVYSVSHLLLLGDFERVVKVGPFLKKCRETAPADPIPLLGQARRAMDKNRLQDAEQLLRMVLERRPEEIEAQARLGEVLLLSGAVEDFLRWQAQLPKQADSHPTIRVVRGLWCRDRGDLRAAARCFWEAVRLAPNYRRANYQLGQVLQALDQPDRAAPFLKRADRLQQLSIIMDGFYRNWSHGRLDVQALQKIVVLTESLGRLWESWAWTQVGLQHDSRLVWAQQVARQLQPLLRTDLPGTLPEYNVAREIDLSSYPLPDWPDVDLADISRQESDAIASSAAVRFIDQALEAGIDFTYFNSADPATPGSRIFETLGGGVAVLDYDGDFWPDCYFTQGATWPLTDGRPIHSDRFYRNRGDGRFEDVTAAAGLGDAGFSQGVTVGDFDNDGFPDLYVANLGANRLYHNNGDGTFTDVTRPSQLHKSDWTTSCLMADLNGDGWPDLYDVNYIAGGDLSRICERDGVPLSCSPLAFLPAQDRLFLNRGDGRFEDVTNAAGIEVPNGYGLGIVAADFDGSGRLSLFVANDQTANFFFVNQSQDGDRLAFVERALPSGLASDAEGKTQACMGVAADDADGDGQIDLFVTNFYNESNVLYLARGRHLFVDQTRQSGLRTPSYLLLGFGTQFLDGELDGLPDLVVANGHIDDLTSQGEPYEMPPQYFRNLGQGQFKELPATSLGNHFQRKWLGRGLARLDWNRDGREDFVVSNMNAPAALVTNQTQDAGNFFAVKLRGIHTGRDAIGTIVRLRTGAETRVRQLTAGDGFQASNQRQLVFGLGNQERVDELEIRWPNGARQTFRNLPGNTEVLLIEGASQPIILSRP